MTILSRRTLRKAVSQNGGTIIMRDCFWIGVWPGLGDEELNYMAETFRTMVKALKS